ncbi:hypothetical protein ACNAW0_24420 [Micromonospora sp. SL1-18]|uniref:hypothetical protein n=1 Tax=Micromonospora sp. SL1-18 TaxID=3399128 RepID=UPI003A4D27FE
MKAHRADVVSFAFGLVFLALSVWWLLGRILGLTLPPVGWFLAGALILVGLLSLVGALRSARHPDAMADVPVADRTATPPADRPEWPAGQSAAGDMRTDGDGDEPGRDERSAG